MATRKSTPKRKTKKQAIAEGLKHTGNPSLKTPFTFGNDLWRLAVTPGKPRSYKTPDDLWQKCIEYFEWNQDNPLYEERVFHNAGIITRTKVAKMRAMTLDGLWIFLGIAANTWYEYKKRTEYQEVLHEAELIIRRQKFEGAAAEFLNANIIARDLGLADKRELSGNDGKPIETKAIMSLDEATRAYLDGLK